MTRIKEYLELLSSEMDGFQSDVKRLETINENLKNLKVSIDLTELKDELDDYNIQLKRQRAYQDQFYANLESLFKKAMAYTKWVMITFVLVILITVASFLYTSNAKAALETFKKNNHTEELNSFEP